MMLSYLEESFDAWLRQNPDIPVPLAEFQFAPPRRWRLDRAWLAPKVAIEIEGVTYENGGRHQRVAGFLADAEKYLHAMRMGWRVMRIPGPWIQEGELVIWKPEVMDTLRELLKRESGFQVSAKTAILA